MIGLIYLFSRRVHQPAGPLHLTWSNDYFPLLLLIFAIGVTGVLMRMFLRDGIDIANDQTARRSGW